MDSIGFWNTRGMNKTVKQEEMSIFLHNSKTSLFGLLETKVKRPKAQRASLNLCKSWPFSTNILAHPNRRIWILWKPMIYEVNIVSVTVQSIHREAVHRG